MLECIQYTREFLQSKIVTGKLESSFKSSNFYWPDSLAGSIAGRKPKHIYFHDLKIETISIEIHFNGKVYNVKKVRFTRVK